MVSVLYHFVPISGTFDKIQQVLNFCVKIITSLASHFTIENYLFKTIFMPHHQKSGGVLCYTLWNFECPSVCPSVRPSAPPPFLCPQLLLQFSASPFQTLQALLGWSEDMHIVFSESWNYFLLHFFFIFNLDSFQALILQKCIGSMYPLPATPPTVLGQSFSNFTGAFRMVWRYAYCFFRILKLFFITFFSFLT